MIELLAPLFSDFRLFDTQFLSEIFLFSGE